MMTEEKVFNLTDYRTKKNNKVKLENEKLETDLRIARLESDLEEIKKILIEISNLKK
jgi:hypothetical protein